MMADEYGALSGHARRARKMDVWEFRSPYSDQKSIDAAYRASVYIVSKYAAGGHTLHFRAESKHFEDDIIDSDIQKLHEKVKRAFEKQDMKSRMVVWTDWIEVEIDHAAYNFRDEHGDGLKIQYSFLKRGVHPETLQVFTINNNGIVVAFPEPKLAEVPDEFAKDDEVRFHLRDQSKQFSYIPATPENVAALETLCGRLAELRGRLGELLSQDRVQDSLGGDLTRLLPAPVPHGHGLS